MMRTSPIRRINPILSSPMSSNQVFRVALRGDEILNDPRFNKGTGSVHSSFLLLT